MAYLLDGGVILVFIIALLVGWKRGLIRSVLGLAACIFSLVLAASLGSVAASGLFDTFIADRLTDTVAEHVPAADTESVVSGMESVLDSLPGFVTQAMESFGAGSPQEILDSVRDALGSSPHTLASVIVARAIRPAAVALLTYVCFVVLFILLMVLFSVVILLINRVFRLPVLRQLNGLLGAAVGAVEGAVLVFILAVLLQWSAAPAGSDALITQDDVKHTLIVRAVAGCAPSFDSLFSAVLQPEK
ncbi:MAG: CvpA family protein [Clostridiales bacterium]|nr:CvpA family protein [Clostridiales bacterium]